LNNRWARALASAIGSGRDLLGAQHGERAGDQVPAQQADDAEREHADEDRAELGQARGREVGDLLAAEDRPYCGARGEIRHRGWANDTAPIALAMIFVLLYAATAA
jgi:hypothetical protein